jgi:hypothetical protein
LSVLVAAGANSGVHLSTPAAITAAAAVAAAAVGPAVLPASRAALRLVRVALLGVILLVVRAKRERLTAILARECPILITHNGLLSIEVGKGSAT